MKLNFYDSNINLSKFNMLLNSFVNKRDIPVKTTKNYRAAEQFRHMIRRIRDDKRVKIIEILASNDDVVAKLRYIGCAELVTVLNRFEIPTAVNLSFAQYRLRLENDWSDNEMAIERLLKEIFGFSLPGKISIALSESYFHNGGNCYSSDPIIIALYTNISKNKKGAAHKVSQLALLLHELLHALIRRSNIVIDSKEEREFEEALLDYFVPIGILAGRLGLIEKRHITEYRNINLKARKHFDKVSARLLPYIERYDDRNETIWNLLSRTEFDKYLTKKHDP